MNGGSTINWPTFVIFGYRIVDMVDFHLRSLLRKWGMAGKWMSYTDLQALDHELGGALTMYASKHNEEFFSQYDSNGCIVDEWVIEAIKLWKGNEQYAQMSCDEFLFRMKGEL